MFFDPKRGSAHDSQLLFPHRPEDDDFDMEEEMRKLKAQRLPRQPDLEPRSRRGLIGDPRVTVIPEVGGPGDNEGDSDSDGPILYNDDDDDNDDNDDEEEEVPPSMFLLFCPIQIC